VIDKIFTADSAALWWPMPVLNMAAINAYVLSYSDAENRKGQGRQFLRIYRCP
jgi:hypothetical protein